MGLKFTKSKKDIVGIDIGASSAKIVALRPEPLGIDFYSIIDITEGATEDAIAAAFSKALAEHGVSQTDINLNISGEFTHMRRMELPEMPPNEIQDALKWKTRDNLPFDSDKAVMDFKETEAVRKDDGSKSIGIIFAAVLKEPLDIKVGLFKKMGLNVTAINLSPFALENIIRLLEPEDPSRVAMIIDMGGSKTDISFYKGWSLQFVRTIPLSSGDITSALCGPLLIDGEERRFSKAEAEEVKRDIGIPYEAVKARNGLTAVQILTMIRGALERFSKEIKISMEYCVSELKAGNPETVYLTGGGSRLKNLERYLEEELKLPVKRLAVPDNIDTSGAAVSDEDAASIMPAVGAALNSSKKVNLLPFEYRLMKVEEAQKLSLRLISVITAAVLAVSFLIIKFRVDDYERRIKNALIHKEVLEQVRPLVREIDDKGRFLQAAEKANLDIEYMMKLISNTIPKSAVLSSMSINQRTRVMEMTGIVRDKSAGAESILANFMEGLERSDLIKDAQLSSIREDAPKDGCETSSFTINCQLK